MNPAAIAPAIPRLRWRIGGLLGVGVLINYFDRISLSVAGPQLQKTLGLSAPELGLLFSAFFWTYALSQIPAGMILDRWGVTRVGRWSAFLWGVASAITAMASGFVGIFAARALLGIAEAVSVSAAAANNVNNPSASGRKKRVMLCIILHKSRAFLMVS